MKIQGKISLLVSSILLGIPLVTFAASPSIKIPPAVRVLEDTDISLKGITVKTEDNSLTRVQLSVTYGKLKVNDERRNEPKSTLELTGSEDKINADLSSLIFRGNLNYSGRDILKVVGTGKTPATVATGQMVITINRPDVLGLCIDYKKQPNEGQNIGDWSQTLSVGSVINYSVVRYNLSDKKSSFNAQAMGFGVSFRFYTRNQLEQADGAYSIADVPLACRARTADFLNFNQAPVGQLPKIGSAFSISPTFYVFKDKDDNNLGTQLALNFGFLNDFLTIGVGWNLSGGDAGEWFLLAGPSIGFQF